MSAADDIESYNYALPEELIAQTPAERRDASRLMVLRRDTGAIEHRRFAELPELLAPGDLLVLNDTQVVPARLHGVRAATGGKWEGLFLRADPDGRWRLIGHTRGKLLPGERLTLLPPGAPVSTPGLELVLERQDDGGDWLARPVSSSPTLELLEQYGTLPLPPYVERPVQAQDRERYQTSYARVPGAVAAPTAGLHFTPEVFARCQARGIETARVTLHVGLGTFRPVSASRLSEHQMHAEWYRLPAETVEAIQDTRRRGGRIIAVGTTSVRTLESVAPLGPLRPCEGTTSLFIRPPYEFQIVQGLLTNFHVPKSTLLVLVSTFASQELVRRAYQAAIEERYRFYSYGDAMLIL